MHFLLFITLSSSQPLLYPLPIKQSRLSKWAKIATVISPMFAIIGLAVAVYFELKPQKKWAIFSN